MTENLNFYPLQANKMPDISGHQLFICIKRKNHKFNQPFNKGIFFC